MKPQEDINTQYVDDMTCLSKFSTGTLPTMHWIYLYSDIYIKVSKFLQTAVYTRKILIETELGQGLIIKPCSNTSSIIVHLSLIFKCLSLCMRAACTLLN